MWKKVKTSANAESVKAEKEKKTYAKLVKELQNLLKGLSKLEQGS